MSNFNSFCGGKACPEYIEWYFNDGASEYDYHCTSCRIVGQSYDINEYPDDCLFKEEIIEYEKQLKKEEQNG